MPTKILPKRERDDLKSEIRRMEATLSDDYESRALENPGKFRAALQRHKNALEAGSPPVLSPEQRQDLMRKQRLSEEAMIKGKQDVVDAMPDRRQMEDNPVGSTGQHMAHEKYWKEHYIDEAGKLRVDKEGYGEIFRWKDRQKAIYPDREGRDPDLCSIERLRPDPQHSQVPLADMKLGVSFAQGQNLTQEQWDAMWERDMGNAPAPSLADAQNLIRKMKEVEGE